MLFSPQIPLPLEPHRVNRFEDFVTGPNRAVVEAVRQAGSEAGASVFVHGPRSAGKTHLLTALCHATRDAGRTAFYAGLKTMPAGTHRTLEGLEGLDVVCVDDLQHVAGDRQWEDALFHFFNRFRQSGGRLVVASRIGLSALPLVLPDLASRLAWGLRLQLLPLGEQDRLEVIRRYAASLGIDLPEDVQDYLLRHGRRSLASLLHSIDVLRHAAITAKRRITVPLAREVVARSRHS